MLILDNPCLDYHLMSVCLSVIVTKDSESISPKSRQHVHVCGFRAHGRIGAVCVLLVVPGPTYDQHDTTIFSIQPSAFSRTPQRGTARLNTQW